MQSMFKNPNILYIYEQREYIFDVANNYQKILFSNMQFITKNATNHYM